MSEFKTTESGLYVPDDRRILARKRIVRALQLTPEILRDAFEEGKLSATAPEILAVAYNNVFQLVLHEGLADE